MQILSPFPTHQHFYPLQSHPLIEDHVLCPQPRSGDDTPSRQSVQSSCFHRLMRRPASVYATMNASLQVQLVRDAVELLMTVKGLSENHQGQEERSVGE